MSDRAAVRDIVRRWGWNGTAYQILNPGFSYWIDRERDAVVGYVERHHVRVVGGAPVCADAVLADVMLAFEQDAERGGHGVIYFCAEQRIADLARRDPRRITFPIGAQPIWSPDELLREFERHKSLRAQLHRARNKGVTTRILRAVDTRSNAELRTCLREWIDRRGLPPLHFLIETETFEDLADRHVIIAEKHGRIIAFLVATPIPARNAWLVEQIVRGGSAPNGVAEVLLHHAATMADEIGASMLTLGLAPLARRGEPVVNNAPSWLGGMLIALRAHGRRFYNFEGLEAFKSKFGGSRWDPVYASIAPGTPLPRAMHAVTSAFTGQPLWRFVPNVLAHAAAREIQRFT